MPRKLLLALVIALAFAARANAELRARLRAADSVAPAKMPAAEMERAGKPHRVKIYPPSGQTAEQGHAFVYREVPKWEPDVFAFLNEQLR